MNEVPSVEKGMAARQVDIMRSVEDDHWWYRALRSQVLASIHSSSPHFALLDAGCGSGGMLVRVREKFTEANLTGIDWSERALEVTEERKTGARLLRGSVDALPFADAEFDVVLSLDVIVTRGVNERAAISEMHRVLKSGGQLILNLAAFDFLRGSHDVAVNGVRRYTRPRLRRLLEEARFTIETFTYWNMTLLPAVAAVRWMSRSKSNAGANVRSDLSPIWRPLDTVLAGLAQAELALSRHVPLPFGTSLFAVARK
jgi:ubiquinone/menaquinone biosynthesis C-methylase UbiE